MEYSTQKSVHSPKVCNDHQTPVVRNVFLHRLNRRALEIFCAWIVVVILLGPIHAEEPPPPVETPSLPATEPLEQPPAIINSVMVDPFIQLQGSVWRTKAGIVFLKTPIGLLTLTSKTTLKDLKASQEVSFWVHER